LGERARGAG
jgi:hypothetical protein